jgi:hypothetical protein
MSTHRIESLMKNSATTQNGWSKLSVSNEVTEHFRHITIGNSINCNGDGLICDHTIEKKIKEIMNKYEISEYKLRKIHTNTIFATEVIVNEESYNTLISRIA